jgi:alkylglycerol monooxygenase
MDAYGKILLIAMPAFLVLVLCEYAYSVWKKQHRYRNLDMISSLSSGITNVVMDVMGLSITILSYEWLVQRVALYQVPDGWFTYAVAFVALDFSGYWVHRWSHQINFFWNKHAIHHSSEEFNLACALRQSVSTFVKLFTILLLPAALLGVPAQVIAVVGPIHLFAQFWYHTRFIDKMGWLEHILVTPSHHRVHHAINGEYLDKNHGQIFIIWDKWFGTFQPELAHVPPVYGITRPVKTWNPFRINFQHLWLMATDAWRTRSWHDKWRVWWMPTGWRPDDVAARYPVEKIDDPYQYRPYNSSNDPVLITWAYLQLSMVFVLTLYFFGHLSPIGTPGIFVYGGFLFLSVYAFTELMDTQPQAWYWELAKNAIGLAIIAQANGQWFGMNIIWSTLLGVYFGLATIITWWVQQRLRIKKTVISTL